MAKKKDTIIKSKSGEIKNKSAKGKSAKGKSSINKAKGNKPLKEIESILNVPEIYCLCCGEKNYSDSYYISDSLQYRAYGRIPYCKSCIDKMYHGYLEEFTKLQYTNPDRRAVQRLCMVLDLYYSNDVYNSAKEEFRKADEKSKNELKFIVYYVKHARMYQNRTKNYNITINDEYKSLKEKNAMISSFNSDDEEDQKNIAKAVKIFGAGFPDEDYLWLLNEYEDWTSRHECQTKSQEDNFKAICHNRLKAYKANLLGESTKDLDKTFKDLLDAGNLQPKQNKGDTLSETQTFGTLIEKWEDTDPIPEIDEELKDVDKLGLYIDVFFKGHLAKMMGLKNGKSQFYDEYMKQYTVTKPEGNNEDEDDTEGLFGKIFGRAITTKEDDE